MSEKLNCIKNREIVVGKNEAAGNLVWIDLEMTGLEVTTDVILEIACVITNGNLEVIEEGPSFIIHQPEEKLAAMGKWCQDHHGKTGLTDAVRSSQINSDYAYQQIYAFIKKNCPPNTGVLAGNSIWQDRAFLDHYMPKIPAYLHYRLVDVTAIKEVIKRWYPDDKKNEYKKTDRHRALSDVYESIAELRHFRKNFFV